MTPRPNHAEILPIHVSENILQLDSLPPGENVYDEKFNILHSTNVFDQDLTYFRSKCSLKECSLVVGYLDINDFKKLNTEYTETRVDEAFLRILMRKLESHLFNKGTAYKEGGDEYLVVLPNADHEDAVRIFKTFQAKIANLTFSLGEISPTVAIGFFVVKPECYLINQEIQILANQTKAEAKKQDNKDCIVKIIEDNVTRVVHSN
ncbi:diguanylate cyclase [Planctomycetota bacterium]